MIRYSKNGFVSCLFFLLLSCAGANSALTQDPLVRCAMSVMDPAEWELSQSEDWVIELEGVNSGASLKYIGARHKQPKTHEQYGKIARGFHALNPTIVFHEGSANYKAKSVDDAISRGGEIGYLQFLAKSNGIPFYSMDLNLVERIRALVQEYDAREVQLFIVLRYIAGQVNQGFTGAALERRALWKAKQVKSIGAQIGINFPIDNLTTLQFGVNQYWPELKWFEVRPEWFTPLNRPGAGKAIIFHEINQAEGRARNREMYASIGAAYLAGERVFAVVGRNHVPLQRPALKCLERARSL